MSEVLLFKAIKTQVSLLDRAFNDSESRFIARAIRATAAIRQTLIKELLQSTIAKYLPASSFKSPFLTAIDSMDTDAETPVSGTSPLTAFYIGFLVLLYLHDAKVDSTVLSTFLIAEVHKANLRVLDAIAAKLFFYHYRNLELYADMNVWVNDSRRTLLASLRTATLRQDFESQAVLLNILLRNYLSVNHFEQADKLISKTVFPEAYANNNQFARYNYYLGRIKAIQLDYTSSNKYLLQAMRKALVSNSTIGFQQSVNKLSIIVQLLMGEIPERSVFRTPTLKLSLAPYLKITSAVRIGDLTLFQDTLAKYTQTFQKDKTFTLILRLRHNVIKAGIRMLSLSYSRISLRDTCLKLQLDSEEDAEYVVGKAIRDGVVDAVINHEEGYMKSKENVDVYSTNEPQNAFHQRISFCLNQHNESVQAMRFPGDAHKKEIELVNKLLDEERKIAQEIAEEDLEDEF